MSACQSVLEIPQVHLDFSLYDPGLEIKAHSYLSYKDYLSKENAKQSFGSWICHYIPLQQPYP